MVPSLEEYNQVMLKNLEEYTVNLSLNDDELNTIIRTYYIPCLKVNF